MTIEIALLLVLVLVLMSLPVVMRRIHGKINQVTPLELSKRANETFPPEVIDIRPSNSFRAGHVPGSRNLTANDLLSLATEIKEKNPGALVLVCQSDLQSTRLAAKLKRNGIEGISVLKGGFFGWKRAHLPVERSG